MIRQKQKREILTKLGMARHEEPLTPQGKNKMTHLSGQNHQPPSKNGWDSKAPGLHLSPGCGEDTVGQLSVEGVARRDPPPEPERERENLPPRRPLKLAPLELPMEVKESQRKKIKEIQQEAMAAARKLDALGNEPRPRKARTDARGGPARSPERPPRRPERDAPGPMKALLPVSQVQANGIPHGEEGVGKAGARGQVTLPSKPALPPDPNARVQAARARQATTGNLGTFQDAGRRRLRLRRAQGLDEDQNKSSMSSAGRLSTDEGKEAQPGKEKGQRAEKALKEASRVLDKATRRSTRPLHHTGHMELTGKTGRRLAVGDIQEAAL